MLKRLVIIVALAICSSAEGRLWETKAELDVRYGKPARYERDGDGGNYTYRFKRFEVLVTMLASKSQSEIYYRSDGHALTADDIKVALSLNAVGGKWRLSDGVYCLVKPAGGHPIAVGIYDASSRLPVLGVCTPDFVKKKSGQVFGRRVSP